MFMFVLVLTILLCSALTCLSKKTVQIRKPERVKLTKLDKDLENKEKNWKLETLFISKFMSFGARIRAR